mgnify:CR=1 FL=1
MYKDKKVIHLVARGLGGEIGSNNKLLWYIPEDLKFFKDSTIGHVVLMGRNTVESLPKPLSRRVIFCVSSNIGNRSEKHSYKSMSLESALSVGLWQSKQLKNDKIFIAGGAQLYDSTFDIVDELWVTQVFNEYPEADTFYHIPEGFEMFEEVMGVDTEDLLFTFQKWKKVN